MGLVFTYCSLRTCSSKILFSIHTSILRCLEISYSCSLYLLISITLFQADDNIANLTVSSIPRNRISSNRNINFPLFKKFWQYLILWLSSILSMLLFLTIPAPSGRDAGGPLGCGFKLVPSYFYPWHRFPMIYYD